MFKSSKFVSRSLIGAVGLSASAIAFLGSPNTAKAADLDKGFDYFLTFGDGTSSIILPGIGIVDLVGTPFDPELSEADTKLERLEDCTFVDDTCTVPLLIHELNLQSTEVVDLSPYGLDPSVVLIRLYGPQETGYITIDQSTNSWWANLPVVADARLPDNTQIVAPDYGPLVFVGTAEGAELVGSGTYTNLDPFDAEGVFFGPIIEDSSLDKPYYQEVHAMTPLAPPVTSVPEPSSIIPLGFLGLAGLSKLKKQYFKAG
ncbi:MAG: PEP-CTERM sorting domain-containing protein [Okeania sp. SIO3B5]|uniref:PEP-CTERM sorting domain-containing protein n=1 Tax=Okeania sp. SIO3B5 TaxID=2607811 RepID=UPI0013FFA08A|nr:PEP-CTERM sorting domain-containing protein [Okeania sp. SIO3B5]NEO55724.1 PEP-CTERM sorting domain-containing protein [Okeania sp. SIO3B5]